MNPSKLCQNIRTSLVNYMKDRRPIQKCLGEDAPFSLELDEQLRKYEFVKDAYVERIPHYSKDSSSTLAALRDAGVIEPETADLFTRVFGCREPEQAKLYSHQGKAIRAVSQDHKNLVVCTGTGSGKTESFLIPVLNAIIAERKREQGRYEPGVRALILYPMNALVNDQVRRLREILGQAQTGTDIPYASEITFGCYTSELEKNVHRTNLSIEGAPRMDVEQVRHPHYSGEAKLRTEYIARSQWNRPADILITNYAMLERLLIDPEKDGIFSPTWKFIVLDEAHSYDGSLGTDIAWLVRRLQQRSGAQDMRFIATSATLTDIDDPEKAKEDIRRNFASRLFPAEADSFVVEMGDRKEPELPAPTAQDSPYVRLVSGASITLPPDLLEDLRRLPDAIRLQTDRGDFNLLELTQWQKESAAWLKQFDELQHADAQLQALGDMLQQARLSARLQPDTPLEMDAGAGAFPQLKKIAEKLKSSLSITEELLMEGEDVKKLATSLSNLQGVRPPLYACLAHALSEAFAGRDTNPMYLAMAWSPASREAIRAQWECVQASRSLVDRVAQKLNEAWGATTGAPAGTKLEHSITGFLEARPHIGRLTEALQTQDGNMTGLATTLFPGETAESAVESFQALAQLLTLTEKEGKPLMDLRFHLLVKTISRFAVYFDDDLTPHPVADDEDTATYQGHRLYTLGICPMCGQPYLLGYSACIDMEHDRSRHKYLFKYATSSQSGGYLHAFSFCEAPDAEEEGLKEGVWLNPESGEIVFNDTAAAKPGWVKLYRYAHSQDAGNTGGINSCPACQSHSGPQRAGDEGLIIRYRTGEARAKTVTLHAIAMSADPSPTAKNMKAQGRKVLSFSDSRAQAAKLASEYDRDTERDITEYAVYHALEQAQNHAVGESERFLESTRYCRDNGLGTRAAQSYDFLANMPQETRETCFDNVKNRYPDSQSLPAILMYMERIFRDAGATHLLTGSYPASVNQQQKEAPKAVNIVLAALSVLRQTGRNSLVRSGAVGVYSCTGERCIQKTQQSDDWEKYCAEFANLGVDDPGLPAAFFRAVYSYLFKHAELDCTLFDSQGEKYVAGQGAPQPVNGGSIYHRDTFGPDKFEFSLRNPFCKKLCKLAGLTKSSRFQRESISELLHRLFNFLESANILIGQGEDYRLNLDDVRFCALEQPKSMSESPCHFRIEEHTAQIATAQGSEYQRLFAEGAINILSCSTTFEMGVDLGSLNCVFMGNMPPGVANYQQRAGRAGRRAGAASCVVTFIGNSSHDRFYATCPEKLFFGGAKRPNIYLDNPTFRAKHMRAVAFHHFLAYVREQNELSFRHWLCSGEFFGVTEMPETDDGSRPVVSYLPGWYRTGMDRLKEACNAIAGRELDYSVAADLCYQMIGTEQPAGTDDRLTRAEYVKALGADTRRYLELDGCNMPAELAGDAVKAPLIVDFNRRQASYAGGARQRLLNGQMVEELSSHRILPKFGFPCDVIELIPQDGDPHGEKVRLSRERKQAIFEYAPKRKVYANKRVFESLAPIRFTRRGEERMHYETNPDLTFIVCPSPNCGYVHKMEGGMATADAACPICGKSFQGLRGWTAICPDGFIAGWSREAKYARETWNQTAKRNYVYCGGLSKEMQIPGTRLTVAQSATRELLYFNKVPFEIQQQRYGGLYHSARTDMVIWCSPGLHSGLPDWDDVRCMYAWRSAAQAIHKAISRVLDISMKDVGILPCGSETNPLLVIFDDSPSGSGVVLPLIKDKKEDSRVDDLSRAVLRAALDISCGDGICTCHQEDDRTPVTHDVFIGNPSEEWRAGNREYKACYHCLKSYSNQRMHPWLDAHDAAVVLRHLLGDATDANAPVEPQPDTVPAEVAPTPQVVVAVPGFVRKMRTGEISPGELFRIRVEQGEVDAYFTDCNPDGSFTFSWEERGETIYGEITADAIICQL